MGFGSAFRWGRYGLRQTAQFRLQRIWIEESTVWRVRGRLGLTRTCGLTRFETKALLREP